MKNVVLLTIDACRKDGFGVYGNTAGVTPFIDSLAEKSIVFNKAVAVGPYTQASFPGILSSSYFLDFGHQELCPRERVIVSQVLKRAGVTTVGIHSNPYLSAHFGWNRGWDLFVDFMDQEVTPHFPFIKGDRINRKSNVWLKSYKMSKQEAPFFMWVHYMEPHEPYIPGKKAMQEVCPEVDLDEDAMFGLFEKYVLKRDVSDPVKVETMRKLYAAHYLEVDRFVEQFFKNLKTLDVLNNTTVIITADHGDEFAEHNGLSHDSTMYSELINIPLMIYNADGLAPETRDDLVSNLNIPPTIAQIMGVEPAPEWRGVSLLGPKEDLPQGCWGECIHKEGEGSGDTSKVQYYMEGDKKLIYREKPDTWEMYDLAADPGEQNNIYSQDAAAGMTAKLNAGLDGGR